MEANNYNELLVNDCIEIDPAGMSPMDMTVIEEATRHNWVIQPLIFTPDTPGDPVRSGILSNINIEMVGDSNRETLENGVFAKATVSREDQKKLLNRLEYQQIQIIDDIITNNIKESSLLNFSNYYKNIFGKTINIRNIDPESYFSRKLIEDNWIRNNVYNYINTFIDFNVKYNLMEAIALHNKENTTGDILPEGSWKDYTNQFSISIAQYIGNMITEALYNGIRYAVYHDNGTLLNRLSDFSVLVEKVNKENIPINKELFMYNYITKYISYSLYRLVAESINDSVYRILCNVPAMYASMLCDMGRFYSDNKDNKHEFFDDRFF